MDAIILNGTLKPSPETSNTEALAGFVARALRERGVGPVTQVRLNDYDIRPGIASDLGDRDAWRRIREQVLAADILIVATPTWLGQISSVTKRALERMDALLSETDDAGVPMAYNKVADAAAHNLVAVARALRANPIGKPPNA
jgi:multimeric flavodoxin WrbA